MPDAALSGIELYQDVKDPNKRWAALSEFEKGLQGQYTLTPEQFSGLEAAGAKVQRVFNDPMLYGKGAFTEDVLRGYQGLAPRAETEMTKATRGISEKYLSGLKPQGFTSTDLSLDPAKQQQLAAGAWGGSANPISSGQMAAPGTAYTPEQQQAAAQVAASIPNVIPQAESFVAKKFTPLSGPSALQGLKETDIARTTGANIYKRDLAAEQQAMSQYAKTFGAPKTDADWRKFHDFVYEGKGGIGEIKPITINPTKATSDQASGKTNQDVIKAMNENITSAPASSSTFMKGLEAKLAKSATLSKDVTAAMQKSQAERDLELQMLQEKQAYLTELEKTTGQPIPMGFIRGQAAAIERRYQNSLSNQQAKLALLQGDRQQKLDAAKFLYDANRNNLSDTLSFYKETAPQNIGTHIDETTGTMYVVTKNPLTGEVSTINAGNVGAGKKYTSTSIQTDPVTNQMLFIGVKPDGSIETKPLTQGGEKPLSSADRLKYAQDMVANSGYTISMEDALKQIDQSQGNVGTSSTAGKSRTDRNNNPTAMTTDVARTLGLVEGVDYVQGDPFQAGNSTLYTAKLIGDPFQTTIKALDNAASTGNKQAFYTQGGAQRWSHTAMSDQQWTAMSPEQKLATVQQMYQRENGTGGSLGPAQSTTAQQAKFDKAPYQNAVQVVRGSLTEAQSKQVGVALNAAINNGDINQARSVILNAAITALPAEQQNKAYGRAVAIEELDNIKTALGQYVASGGNTGLIAGTVEGIAQRIGRTSDPKLAAIGNQIQASIVAYRNAVSGAAFTESEKKAYDDMFPSSGKTPALNEALIDSLSDSFRRNQGSVLSQKIGDKNYQQIFGYEEAARGTTADDILKESGIVVSSEPQQAPTTKESTNKQSWWDYFFGAK